MVLAGLETLDISPIIGANCRLSRHFLTKVLIVNITKGSAARLKRMLLVALVKETGRCACILIEKNKELILQIAVLVTTLIATISMGQPGWFIFGLVAVLLLN
jgi:hypothetical protein